MPSSISLSVFLAIVFSWCAATAQEVQFEQIKNGVALGISADKTYQLTMSQERKPQLVIECAHKGKKFSQQLLFSPGGLLVPDQPEAGAKSGEALVMVINNSRQVTHWIPYGDGTSYAYAGSTEADREQFIHTVLSSPTIKIEFHPFLTGADAWAAFDVSKLAEEIKKHPECTTQ